MRFLVRILAIFLASIMLLGAMPRGDNSGSLGVSAQSACLIEAESGRALYEKNASKRLPMASTTKIMSAIVAIESGISPSRIVKVDSRMVGIEGSSIYLRVGERISFEALLYALLLSSANDAAVAIAITALGSVEGFVTKMNQKARELGLTNTHFTNPHGLYDKEHYTTAYDLAKIMAYAMKNEIFSQITATEKIVIPRDDGGVRVLINHNRLLGNYEGVIGGKTGFTKKSGRCLVSCAKKDGLTLIAVTLNAPNDWNDHKSLFDFGFSNYEMLELEGISISLPVISGNCDYVSAKSEGTCIFMPKEHNKISRIVKLPRFVFADVKSGDELGRLIYKYNGKTIASLPILAQEDVEKIRYKFNLIEWLKNLLGV